MVKRKEVGGKYTVELKLNPKERVCLRCNKLFKSSWIGNRRCSKCSERIVKHYQPRVMMLSPSYPNQQPNSDGSQ